MLADRGHVLEQCPRSGRADRAGVRRLVRRARNRGTRLFGEAAGGAVADLERLFATFPGDFGELQHQADIRFGERGELINGIGHETVNLSLRV